MGGILVYGAGSVVSLFAPGIEVLIVGRVLQALGACSAIVAVRASVRDALEPAEGARLLARAGSWMGLAPLTGPLAGGLLLAAFGWRASFAVLSAAALLLALAAGLRLRETNRHLRPDALRPAALVASYRAVLQSPTWHAYAWIGAASYAGLFAWLSGSSFVLIRVLGVSPPVFGVIFSAVVAGFMTGSLLCGRSVARYGMQKTVYLAVTLQLLSGGVMVALALAGVRAVAALAVPQFVFLVGHGLSQPVSQAGAVAPFPRQAGAASAMQGVCMMLVAAATGQWIGYSYDGTLVPLAATVATAGCAGALLALTLVRRHGAPPHVTQPVAMTTTAADAPR
jgi:DHA1 family bicyclomycin/chloramphenicol resistance-like MFS transporter